MSATPIRVGFIGLNPDSNWAFNAHLPTLKALSADYRIVGVANSTAASAERTARALGIEHAFASPRDLVASDLIDLVVVTVKVPYHLELVTLALQAGKHVYCEWPLGNGLAEARQLAALAEAKGVVAVVGTQALFAPEVQQLAQLIREGYVGRVLSTTLIGSGGNWANTSSAALAYLFDSANGATMEAIPMGHTLAALVDVLGEIGPLTATYVSNFDTVKITETGEEKPKSAPDQVMVQGQLASGAAFSVHYRGGVSRGTNLLWEINGTEGDLQITGGLGHAQLTQLSLRGAKGAEKEMAPITSVGLDQEDLPAFAGARNIAGIYKALAQDIRSGSRSAPTFADALALHELLDRIEASAKRG